MVIVGLEGKRRTKGAKCSVDEMLTKHMDAPMSMLDVFSLK
jgi:hypothetical protein